MGSQMSPYGGYLGSQGPYGDVWGQGCHHRGIYGVTGSLWGYMGSQMSPYGDIWGHRVPMGIYGDRDVTLWGHLGTGDATIGGYMGSG